MPKLTPPELRRKRAEREAEGHRLYDEYTRDGRQMTDEEFRSLEGIAAETAADGPLARQIEAAERWGVVDQAAAEGRQSLGRETNPMPHNDEKNTRKGRHQFRVLRAIRLILEGRQLDGIEGETTIEMRKERTELGCSKTQGNLMIPLDLPVDLDAASRFAQRSGLPAIQVRSGLDLSAGAGSIPTILDSSMIDILRARMVTRAMGARVLTGMQGLFAIPRQNQASTFYMVLQGGTISASNQTVDQVPFAPHTGGVNTTYSRQLLEQTNLDAEMFVRNDQAEVIARGVETQALNGQGTAGYPLGLMQNPLITIVAGGTNGLAPSWANLVKLETQVAIANADMGSLGYLTDAAVRGTLKTTVKVTGYPTYLWDTSAPGSPVNGYPVAVTNLLPANLVHGSGTSLHAILFGNWADLYFAFWSGLDTLVDPYTLADSGAVRIVTLQDFDTNIRHPESFAITPDVIVS